MYSVADGMYRSSNTGRGEGGMGGWPRKLGLNLCAENELQKIENLYV